MTSAKECSMCRQQFIALILTTALLLAAGCGKKDEAGPTEAQAPVESNQPSPPSRAVEAEPNAVAAAEPNDPSTVPGARYLGEALVSWNMGQKDTAAEQFRALRWDDPTVFQGIPGAEMTAEQWAALSQARQNGAARHAEQLADALRALVQHVVSVGARHAAAGDDDRARTYFEAVRQCGQALSSPEHLAAMQELGREMIDSVGDKLETAP